MKTDMVNFTTYLGCYQYTSDRRSNLTETTWKENYLLSPISISRPEKGSLTSEYRCQVCGKTVKITVLSGRQFRSEFIWGVVITGVIGIFFPLIWLATLYFLVLALKPVGKGNGLYVAHEKNETGKSHRLFNQ